MIQRSTKKLCRKQTVWFSQQWYEEDIKFPGSWPYARVESGYHLVIYPWKNSISWNLKYTKDYPI